MKIDGYLKFLLTIFVMWLFLHTFMTNKYSLDYDSSTGKYSLNQSSTGRYTLHNHSPFGNSEDLYRMDNLTGQTHVYDIKSGGWVLIVDTGMMIVPKEKN